MRYRKVVLFILASIPMLALFQNCSDNYKIDTAAPAPVSLASQAQCLFDGVPVADGGSITAYHDSSEPFGQACYSQQRTCTDGQLSGTYAYASCTVNAPQSCLFNGQTISSGNSATAYSTSTVPFGQTCISQSRICTNGALSGSYPFASCTPDAPASCLFNGQTVASGSAISGYLTSSVPFGQTCSSETRTCLNGVLSGSDTFASCDVGSPVSCLFNGQTIPSGNTVTAYQNASVSAGATCTSEIRTCTNGALSGSFANASCTVAVCDPFTAPGPNCSSSSPGLQGSLFYEPQATVAAQGGWSSLATYFSQGTNTNITLILSQLNVPTENFSVGFPIGNGQYLSDLNGNKLVEWFAIQVDGILKMDPNDSPGNYEFATLTDDGSILYLRDPVSGQLVQRINNDGAHSTKLQCIDSPVALDSTTQIPMRLQYFQGPRTEIALRMLYRKASSTPESLCGTSSNFFVSTGAGNPYPEGSAMTQLYNDGWKVVPSTMFGSP